MPNTVLWGNYPQAFEGGGNQTDLTSNGSGNITGTLTIYATIPAAQTTQKPGSWSEPMPGGTNNDLQYGSLSSAGSCPIGASTANYSFNVTATVITACNVSVGSLNFGSSAAVITANINSTATITAQCTKTTPYSVGLDNGLNASGSQRQMRLGSSGSYVNYSLYTDSARTLAWTTTTSTTTCTSGTSTCDLGTGTGANQTYTIYGQVPPQTVPVSGTFNDTVVVTATY